MDDELRRRVLERVDIGPRPGDMEWSYWPVPGGGCFSAYHLRIIADELDRRNKLDRDVSDSVKNAQRDGVCRLCGEDCASRLTPDGKIDELVVDFGREFAHRTCIEREKRDIASQVSGEHDVHVWAWAVIDNEQFISEPGTDPTHVFRNYCDVQAFVASRQLDRLVIVKLGPVELQSRMADTAKALVDACRNRDRLHGELGECREELAELEGQLESVADRAAAAETALEAAPAASGNSSAILTRSPAASGAVNGEISDGVLALEHMLYVFRDDQRPAVQSRMEKLRRLVELLRDQAPAASGAAGTEQMRGVVEGLIAAAEAVRDWAGLPSELNKNIYRSALDDLGVAIAAAEMLLTQPRPATTRDRVALLDKMEQCGIPLPAASDAAVAWEHDVPTPHGTGRGVVLIDPVEHPELWEEITGMPVSNARPLVYQAAPAASGAAGTEDVWAVEDRYGKAVVAYTAKELAISFVEVATGEDPAIVGATGPFTIAPRYRQPQQPAKGWLTPEERHVIKRVSEHLFETSQLEFTDIVTLDALLARSTPEVVLPVVLPVYCGMPHHTPIIQGVWDDCISRVQAALAAAGVPWKEVGK